MGNVRLMSAAGLIDQLSAIHPKGYDLSLGRIRTLLSHLDNPHLRIPPPIHVAGTNGKGSTIAFCRAILEAAGKIVHVHTSPHLVHWHERFRIGAPGGGRLVGDAALESVIARVADTNNGEPITVFELLSAAMFVLFSEHPADFSLIEVGLGGRFDATNVLENPLISVITNVSLDHQAQLGDREELIAQEKAGIIKRGCPVVIGPQPDTVRAVLEEAALDRGAPTIVAGQDFTFLEQGGRLVYQDNSGLLDLPLPRLRGAHQLANAATAIATIRHCHNAISEVALEKAMETAYWPGRMERLRQGKLHEAVDSSVELWIDGGHNPSAGLAIASVIADLEERAPMPVFLVAAMLTTKEPEPFFRAFAGLVEHAFTVPVPATEAGYPARELAEAARRAGLNASACLSVADALGAVSGLLAENEPGRVLICGSLYLIGDVLRNNGTLPQ
jgi:dihydrofolate synthase / folylpolyglutamate synthase